MMMIIIIIVIIIIIIMIPIIIAPPAIRNGYTHKLWIAVTRTLVLSGGHVAEGGA